MTTPFDTAQAVYDAAEPEDAVCHHDGDFSYFPADDGSIYMVCQDCYECIADPESEECGA